MLAGAGSSSGVVTAFDARSGLGELRDGNGTVVAFQCLAIADGSRTIDVGTAVRFTLRATLGRYEAWDIRPASAVTEPGSASP